MRSTAAVLNDQDFCHRLPVLAQSWERAALSFMQLLSRGVEHGLTCEDDDPGYAAGARVMSLAVARPIETPQSDLLGLAEHVAALADMITWILRPEQAWKRPEPGKVGNHTWTPESFVAPGGLRRLVMVDRWDEARQVAEQFNWVTLESAIYEIPMMLVVVVLGASRGGRRHGPLSKGWIQPVTQKLRFRRKDGTEPEGDWEPIFREKFRGEQGEWFQALIDDGVYEETIVLHPVSIDPSIRGEIRRLSEAKLSRLLDGTLPDPQLQQCFDSVRVCQFRSCCPYSRSPARDNGFLPSEYQYPLLRISS